MNIHRSPLYKPYRPYSFAEYVTYSKSGTLIQFYRTVVIYGRPLIYFCVCTEAGLLESFEKKNKMEKKEEKIHEKNIWREKKKEIRRKRMCLKFEGKKKKRCFSKNRLSHWIFRKKRGLTKKEKGKSNGRKTISPAVEKIRINLESKKYLSRSVAF